MNLNGVCHKNNTSLSSSILLYFSAMEWAALYQRPHQLVRVMQKDFERVLFIQPAGLRNIRARDFSRVMYWLRDKIKVSGQGTLENGIRTKHESTELCSPAFIPFNGSPPLDRLNSRICHHALRSLLHHEKSLVLWVSAPFPYLPYFLTHIKRPYYLIYDVIDDFSLFHPEAEHIFKVHDKLVKKAHLVFASSEKLLESTSKKREKVPTVLLPNGVDPAHWNAAIEAVPPREMQNISRPVIGYFGCISHWLDIDLLSCLARKRHDWQFVFIGPATGKNITSIFSAMPNVHLFGKKPYSRLPAFAVNFDVCWVPFKVNEMTRTINPLKVYEYLALGKPVIAPPLPDLAKLKPAVVPASSTCEFEKGIESLLQKSKSPAFAEECRQLALEFSWSNIWEKGKVHLQRMMNQTAGLQD